MKIKLDRGAKMPHRAHATDAGYDLCSRRDAFIPPKGSRTFDTGVHVEIPEGYVGFVKSKSGLMCRHDIVTDGTIDAGYTGSIVVKLFNRGWWPYKVNARQKIAQLVILPIITPKLELVDELDYTERGTNGFGSSGVF